MLPFQHISSPYCGCFCPEIDAQSLSPFRSGVSAARDVWIVFDLSFCLVESLVENRTIALQISSSSHKVEGRCPASLERLKGIGQDSMNMMRLHAASGLNASLFGHQSWSPILGYSDVGKWKRPQVLCLP